jgi:RND family efflux transporter MFP subunit
MKPFSKTHHFPAIPRLMLACVTAAIFVTGCAKSPVNDPRQQPPRVATFKVRLAEPGQRAFTGIVEARVQSSLGFRVGGKVLERAVAVGQSVKRGQVLMRLDPVDLNLSVAAQQANVEAARARFTQARADEARIADLVRSGAVSRQDYDIARAALDSSKALLEAAEAQSKVTSNASEYTSLLADADGVIIRTLSEPGQVVAAGQTVIELAQNGPREALINLPEGMRPDLGSSGTAQLHGHDQSFPARLRELSDAADPTSRTFAARYVLEGEAASIPLGTTVTITLANTQSPRGQLVVVPSGAVHDGGSGPGVWIVDDRATVKFRAVKIASISKEEIAISSGLQAGETVIALGAHLLNEGQSVNPGTETKLVNARL